MGKILLVSCFVFLSAFFAPAGFAAEKGADKPGLLNCVTELREAGADQASVSARVVGNALRMENIKGHLAVLAGEKPVFLGYKLTDRYTDANREWTRLYLVQTLQKMGYEIRIEAFGRGMNLVVEARGTRSPNEVFEATAHYDTQNHDVPGYDDNGSGLGWLLEMARLLKAHPPDRTVRLVFMDLEERGFDGSRFHAAQLKEEFLGEAAKKSKKRFVGALVVDTIGFNPSEDKQVEQQVVLEVGEEEDFDGGWGEGRNKTLGKDVHGLVVQCTKEVCFQFAAFADSTGKREGVKLIVDKSTAKPETADHGSYWKAQFPAVLLAAPYKDPYINPGYHTRNDTQRNVNWAYYGKMARFATEIVALGGAIVPTLEADDVGRAALEMAVIESNREVHRTDDHVTSRVAPAEPSYLSDWSSSYMSGPSSNLKTAKEKFEKVKAERIIVLVTNERHQCDIVDMSGQNVFIVRADEVKEVVELAHEKGIVVIQKLPTGMITFDDIGRAKEWRPTFEPGKGKSAPEKFKLEPPPEKSKESKIEDSREKKKAGDKKPSDEKTDDAKPEKGKRSNFIRRPWE